MVLNIDAKLESLRQAVEITAAMVSSGKEFNEALLMETYAAVCKVRQEVEKPDPNQKSSVGFGG